jgi:hypothetical protein
MKNVYLQLACNILIYGRGKFVGDFIMGNIICANFTTRYRSG